MVTSHRRRRVHKSTNDAVTQRVDTTRQTNSVCSSNDAFNWVWQTTSTKFHRDDTSPRLTQENGELRCIRHEYTHQCSFLQFHLHDGDRDDKSYCLTVLKDYHLSLRQRQLVAPQFDGDSTRIRHDTKLPRTRFSLSVDDREVHARRYITPIAHRNSTR